ncbi:uncharacterized protein LOC127277136 [Leptopilina boulardi]|uniref:uncharacterized protein LOC127277136 n=1 Tax=Leptopilina boulardi TaxID=63433 RepID=UPI0021F683FB|nr:uncharacterized protein LOC127277136 [Leptopilina boulardi]
MEAYNSHMKINKYFLCATGLWPYQSKRTRKIISLFIWFIHISFLIPQLLALRNNWGNTDILFEWLPPCFVNAVSLSCFTAASVHRNKIELILSKIKEDWLFCESDEEFEILHENGILARNLNNARLVFFYMAMLQFLTVPLIPSFLDAIKPLNESRIRKLIFPTDYLVDSNNNNYYTIIAIHHWHVAVILITIILTVDRVFIFFIYHACGQFEILGLKMKNLVNIDYNIASYNERNVQKRIKFCIERHKSVLVFVNHISDCFSATYFLGLGFNMLAMSFTGVQLVMNLDNIREALAIGSFTLGQVLRLFTLTIPSQRLIDQSSLLSQNIYSSCWYNLSPESKKLLKIIMMRCINPCTFTVGKLYTFSMRSFGIVIKLILSKMKDDWRFCKSDSEFEILQENGVLARNLNNSRLGFLFISYIYNTMETYKSYLIVNKYFLCAIGAWPKQKKIKKWAISIFVWINLLSFLAAQITALVKFGHDFDIIIATLPPFFSNSISIACLVAISINSDKMRIILSKMEKQWIYWATKPNEIELVRENADLGRKLSIRFIVVVYVIMIEYLSVPIIPIVLDVFKPLNQTRSRRLIFVADYCVNTDDYYFWILLHAIIGCVTRVTVFLSIDCIFIVFIYHACGQLAILGFRLKNLVSIDYDQSTNDEDVMKRIKFCIKLHKSIIIFVNDIKECFSTPYFFAVGLNMLMMSFTMIQMIINIHSPKDVFAFLCYAFGQMFMLLCLTLPCQRLIDLSQQIPTNIHNGFWYKMSIKSQKMLLIIIRRSANPCTFTAGKLYTFSIENFGAVVKASFSYLTVLSSVRE